MRFIIYVSQNNRIAKLLVNLFFKNPNPSVAYKGPNQSVEDFKSNKNQEFRLTILRNIILVYEVNKDDFHS